MTTTILVSTGKRRSRDLLEREPDSSLERGRGVSVKETADLSEDEPTENTLPEDLLLRIGHAKDFECVRLRANRVDMQAIKLA